LASVREVVKWIAEIQSSAPAVTIFIVDLAILVLLQFSVIVLRKKNGSKRNCVKTIFAIELVVVTAISLMALSLSLSLLLLMLLLSL